jgi:hypothetical protein
LAALITGAGTASPARAQLPIDSQSLFGRSAWENGDLSLFRLNRMPTGARSIGMGMTGLAIDGGPSYRQLNPTAALGALRPTLVAESKFIAGSATPQSYPEFLDFGGILGELESSDYRVSYKFDYDYDDLSFATPITLFGNRGALAASYSRSARTGRETETRVELQGQITQQAEATWGTGDVPDQGMDVLSFGVAREIASFMSLGANFNWYSGELKRSVTQGVSIFGTQLSAGGQIYQQDVSGFNVDLGTQFDFGNLGLGGVVYLGHDLKFEAGKAQNSPLPPPGQTVPINYDFVPLDMTLNVPTMFGGGASYQFGERLLAAADFWYRPWSKSNITRQSLDVGLGFTDSSDPTSYVYALFPVEGQEETFTANFENLNSFSVGVEWLAVHKPTLDVPLRIGFSRGKIAQNNVEIPNELWDQYDDWWMQVDPEDTTGLDGYSDLVGALYVALTTAAGDSITQSLANTLAVIDEYNLALFRGSAPDMNTLTLGAGVRIKNFTADLGLAFNSFTWTRFYLQSFDPTLWPVTAVATEKRSVTDIVLSIGMVF